MKNNNEFIGVNHVSKLTEAVSNKASEFIGEEVPVNEEYSKETYKLAFETLAKHVVGYAEANDNGSLLLNIIMESTELDDTEEGLDAFMLIEQAMSEIKDDKKLSDIEIGVLNRALENDEIQMSVFDNLLDISDRRVRSYEVQDFVRKHFSNEYDQAAKEELGDMMPTKGGVQ
ncbi:hypothetical protein [Bacillus solitudinis]|uniref:hypothetical protein n=1 Tax=Bacillus solitudinis TaxID=2014074 RepID=UPI000C23C0CC|nr:hypothetical protein [Bacillus solitudinis]